MLRRQCHPEGCSQTDLTYNLKGSSPAKQGQNDMRKLCYFN